MAEYELTITKRTLNPNYKPPKMEEIFTLRYDERVPQFIEHKELQVTIDEATFAAIRKAAIETL